MYLLIVLLVILQFWTIQYTSFHISEGYYPIISHLVNAIEKKINMVTNETVKRAELTYDQITHKVKGLFHHQVIMTMPTHTQRMIHIRMIQLNVNNGREWEVEEVVGLDVLDSLYVYCDVGKPRVVGDNLTPHFRIMPVDSMKILARCFNENVHYVRVQGKTFQTLEINKRECTG